MLQQDGRINAQSPKQMVVSNLDTLTEDVQEFCQDIPMYFPISICLLPVVYSRLHCLYPRHHQDGRLFRRQ